MQSVGIFIATSNSRLQSRSLYYDDDDDDDDADDALADDDDDHLRVACYPRAPVSHVTLGRPFHVLSQGGRVTCYPGRPGVALEQTRPPRDSGGPDAQMPDAEVRSLMMIIAILAYAPHRQEPATLVTPRFTQQSCARESFRKNLGKDFLVAA